jgi:AraC-like DNA-binding protein
MRKRTLTRRFRDETGVSLIQWLNQQRLHLPETLGVSPSAYRATFRGPVPS